VWIIVAIVAALVLARRGTGGTSGAGAAGNPYGPLINSGIPNLTGGRPGVQYASAIPATQQAQTLLYEVPAGTDPFTGGPLETRYPGGSYRTPTV